MIDLRKVSVAVLSWNGLEHLKTCLAALSEQDEPGLPWEVLVLDNGSTDGTSEWVHRHHPQVRLIPSPVNLGFCTGNNRLVQEAQGEAIAFLNNDARPQRSWLAALVKALATAPDDVAAVSGTILDWSGERLDFAEGIMTFDGHAFQRDYHRLLTNASIPQTGTEIFFPCGGNMMIRRRAFLDVGGFDQDYFAYFEDVDLGWRLWARGERVISVREAVVYHRSMATSNLLGAFNRGFLFERNAFLTVYKNYEPELWEKLMPIVLLTLINKAHTLLIENNPRGDILRLDPYAGGLANTVSRPQHSAAQPSPFAWEPLVDKLGSKWQAFGPLEFFRRGLSKLTRGLLSQGARIWGAPPVLTDKRTVAQFRSLSYILGHLDEAAEKRQAIQARRRRSDREIFKRFPLYLIPTYPGEEELFSSSGFTKWLPKDLPLVRKKLDEIMELDSQ